MLNLNIFKQEESAAKEYSVDLSIITPTWNRANLLTLCVESRRRQILGGLQVEHIVVFDGPHEPTKRFDAYKWNDVRVYELEEHQNDYGSDARNLGLEKAKGRYVCFWDDDNYFHDNALSTIYAAACNADIGVVQVYHTQLERLVPKPTWNTSSFVMGDIDTACYCVKSEYAKKVKWDKEDNGIRNDYRWIRDVHKLIGPKAKINFVPLVIANHI